MVFPKVSRLEGLLKPGVCCGQPSRGEAEPAAMTYSCLGITSPQGAAPPSRAAEAGSKGQAARGGHPGADETPESCCCPAVQGHGRPAVRGATSRTPRPSDQAAGPRVPRSRVRAWGARAQVARPAAPVRPGRGFPRPL